MAEEHQQQPFSGLKVAPERADTEHLMLGFDNSLSSGARAAIVNRTHRVVRERAEQMQAQRNNGRELVVPLLVCSVLLLMISYAMWSVLGGSTVTMGEIGQEAEKLLDGHAMDMSGSLSILFFWFLPVSAVALGTILFQRSRRRNDGEVTR